MAHRTGPTWITALSAMMLALPLGIAIPAAAQPGLDLPIAVCGNDAAFRHEREAAERYAEAAARRRIAREPTFQVRLGEQTVGEILQAMAREGEDFDPQPLHAFGHEGLAAILDAALGPAPASAETANLSALLSQLDAPDWRERESATQAVVDLHLGRSLQAEVADTPLTLEMQMRLKTVGETWHMRKDERLTALADLLRLGGGRPNLIAAMQTYLHLWETRETADLLADRLVGRLQQVPIENHIEQAVAQSIIHAITHQADEPARNLLAPRLEAASLPAPQALPDWMRADE